MCSFETFANNNFLLCFLDLKAKAKQILLGNLLNKVLSQDGRSKFSNEFYDANSTATKLGDKFIVIQQSSKDRLT